MHIHIIGICGTFMGGVARLAKELGHSVSGSDANTYPPMSTLLETLGVELMDGYAARNLPAHADIIVVGNSISRGNPELEAVLDQGLAYTSGAQWLSEHVLNTRWVLAVAGTHGKTTTASMVAWILEECGYMPGFLIGGVPANFNESARLGKGHFFVIEADEYDTAFCDKRSKFVHYRPRTLVINNLEFDHADIFDSLDDIKKQFHHLLRTVPSLGRVIHNHADQNVQAVLDMGCWSEQAGFSAKLDDQNNTDSEHPGSTWMCTPIAADCHTFTVHYLGNDYHVDWSLIGHHNMLNALAAVAAAHHVGVQVGDAVAALANFRSVKRRLEVVYDDGATIVYDDFAHHPTAIRETLNGLRNKVGDELIIAVLEPRSNTMKRGVHKEQLADALQAANRTLIYADKTVQWNVEALHAPTSVNDASDESISGSSSKINTYASTEALLTDLLQMSRARGPLHILIMSNGGFDGLHTRLVNALTNRKFT